MCTVHLLAMNDYTMSRESYIFSFEIVCRLTSIIDYAVNVNGYNLIGTIVVSGVQQTNSVGYITCSVHSQLRYTVYRSK